MLELRKNARLYICPTPCNSRRVTYHYKRRATGRQEAILPWPGIGIFDKNKTSNILAANRDVARYKGSRLLEQVNSRNNKIPTGVK